MKRTVSALLVILLFALSLASCGKKSEDAPGTHNGDSSNNIQSASDSTEDESSEPEPEPKDNRRKVSFFAAGDNIIHECVYLDAMTAAAAVGAKTDYYFDSMYSNVKDDISKADVAFINAEGPLNTSYKPNGYPSFNAPAEAGDALVNVGFDVINLANNHMLDMKKGVGMQGTIDYWKTKNVVTVGAYENKADYNNIRVVEKNGIKTAFLSYTYGTNGISLGSDTPNLYIPYINDSEITRQISEAKQVADMVFVSMHWGQENLFEPTSEQKRLAKLMADNGVDVVIGHHSHTIEPIEWINGKSGNRTLVIYSLGNFIHTQVNSKNLVGAFVTFDVISENGEKPTVSNVLFTPTVCHYTANTAVFDSLDYYKRENVKIYKLSDYTEELAKAHGCQYWTKFSLSTLKGYVSSTIAPEFLPDNLK